MVPPNPAQPSASDQVRTAAQISQVHIFDFDATLFKSPKKPDWWRGSWWSNPASLSDPCVPTRPDSDWWIQKQVSQAKQSIADSNTYAVICTGRDQKVEKRLKEILRSGGLRFDKVYLKPGGDTESFKKTVLTELVKNFPGAELHFWEDRHDHLRSYMRHIRSLGGIGVPHPVPELYAEPLCTPEQMGMTARTATKSHGEKEDEEAERLVRQSPKKKPSRSDSKREHMDTGDPDLNEDDKDTSLNYKRVGQNVARRFLGKSKRQRKKDLAKQSQKEPEHKPGDVWPSESGEGFAAMNPEGQSKGGFSDEDAAKAFAAGGAEEAPEEEAAQTEEAPKDEKTQDAAPPKEKKEPTPQEMAKKRGLPPHLTLEQQDQAISAQEKTLEKIQSGQLKVTPEMLADAQNTRLTDLSTPMAIGVNKALQEYGKGAQATYADGDPHSLVENGAEEGKLKPSEEKKLVQQYEERAKLWDEKTLQNNLFKMEQDLKAMQIVEDKPSRGQQAAGALVKLLDELLKQQKLDKAQSFKNQSKSVNKGKGTKKAPPKTHGEKALEEEMEASEERGSLSGLGPLEERELHLTGGVSDLREYLEGAEEYAKDDDDTKALAEKLLPLMKRLSPTEEELAEGAEQAYISSPEVQNELRDALDNMSMAQISSFFPISDYEEKLKEGLGLKDIKNPKDREKMQIVMEETIKNWIVEDLETEHELETVGMMTQHAALQNRVNRGVPQNLEGEELDKAQKQLEADRAAMDKLQDEIFKRKGWSDPGAEEWVGGFAPGLEGDEEGEAEGEKKPGLLKRLTQKIDERSKKKLRERVKKDRKASEEVNMTISKRVVARYMGLPGPLSENDPYNPPGPEQPTKAWSRAEGVRLTPDDLKVILGSARDWLQSEVVQNDWSGSDLDYRMALDYAIWTVQDGAYQAQIHPNTYEGLLKELRG